MFGRRLTFAICLILTLAVVCLAPSPAFAIDWGFGLGSQPKVGTPDWWSKHKKSAVFVPEQGYQVPGFEGFFDEKGRSISAPVDEIVRSLDGKEEKGLLPQLDPKYQYKKVKSAVGLGPNQSFAKAQLAEGQQLYDAKQFSKAEGPLKTAIDRWPNSGVHQQALFLLGDCYFFQDKYTDARDTFNKLLSEYPNSRNTDDVIERQWRIAQYWERYYFDVNDDAALKPNLLDKTRPTFDTIGNSIKTYESIRLNDPTGPRADDAIMATASIYFRRERYQDADYHYTLLRSEYSRSDFIFEAHLLGLQSKLRKYQGADYDGAALEEAKKLSKQIRAQFSGRLTDVEKDRLRLVEAELQRLTEQRDLRMAQFYDKTAHFGAARYYYAKITNEYTGSPIANQAQTRLAQIGGEPAVPEKKLAWFVDLFPENREIARLANIPEIRDANTPRLAENPRPAASGVQPASATSPATGNPYPTTPATGGAAPPFTPTTTR